MTQWAGKYNLATNISAYLSEVRRKYQYTEFTCDMEPCVAVSAKKRVFP
jgi:hypothetical protein